MSSSDDDPIVGVPVGERYAVGYLPKAMAEDEPAWKAHWRHRVEADGYTPIGEPELERFEEHEFVSEDPVRVMYVAVGPVRKKESHE
jgi:hypothetical protein